MSTARQRSGSIGSGRRRFAAWLAVFGLLANLLVPILGAPPAQAAAAGGPSVFAEDTICHANGEQPQKSAGGHHGLGEACSLCLLLGHGGGFVDAAAAEFLAAPAIVPERSFIPEAQAPLRTAAAPIGSRAPPVL